jgi:hypothetical protein
MVYVKKLEGGLGGLSLLLPLSSPSLLKICRGARAPPCLAALLLPPPLCQTYLKDLAGTMILAMSCGLKQVCY